MISFENEIHETIRVFCFHHVSQTALLHREFCNNRNLHQRPSQKLNGTFTYVPLRTQLGTIEDRSPSLLMTAKAAESEIHGHVGTSTAGPIGTSKKQPWGEGDDYRCEKRKFYIRGVRVLTYSPSIRRHPAKCCAGFAHAPPMFCPTCLVDTRQTLTLPLEDEVDHCDLTVIG